MFVLDEEINNVKNNRILPLLNEIKSSFYSGNYRSAVVITYTAIVFDVLDKLTDLSEIYQDPAAQDILKQVEVKRNNKNSSEWENFLIDEANKRTELIDDYELEDLMEIKRQRNNAAHPTTTYDGNTWELKTISKETCQDIIRKSFEIIFLKPPILGRKINNKIIDFANKSYHAIGITEDDFKRAIQDQYLNQLGKGPKEQLLKSLFKLIFKQAYSDKAANTGRQSSFALLKVLISDSNTQLLDTIKSDIEKFALELENYAELSLEYNDLKFDQLKSLYFADLIREFPLVKDWIKESTKINLKNNLAHMLDGLPGVADNTKKILLTMKCTTVIDDCEVHLQDVLTLLEEVKYNFRLSSIEANDLDKLYDTFCYYGKKEQLIEFLLDQMTNAVNFNQANKDFLIYSWLIEKLTEEQIYEMLAKINENNQYYWNSNLVSFVDEFVAYYKETNGIDLRINYLGAIYTNLDILSDEHTLSTSDYELIFEFFEDRIESHSRTIHDFQYEYKEDIKANFGNSLENFPKLNELLFE
ncbi:hypothetical protein [Enterococcus faecalis]|uniref:hypothetical protein n=1 Tax=Enterococcus faecalis TaxID=1351 RepID=UPI00045096E1|nr:hypothetical protein [Enterococcus faecalis]ETT89177.1 hypothetical protein P001_02910 [Enterococcus faecalis EnGen0401]ETT89284.1 hypothetical protein P001_02789 [Enterococcus faecalis EnGen0401]